LLMHAPKHPQIGSQAGANPFARVAMHFSDPIAIVIPRPLVRAVAYRSMRRMAAGIGVGLVGIEHRAADRDVLINQLVAGALIRVLTDPKSVFAALARHQVNDRRTIVSVGAAPALLIGPPPRRIGRIAMRRTFFPPRSDRVRRPRRSCPASAHPVRSHSHWSARAAATYGLGAARARVRAPAVRSGSLC